MESVEVEAKRKVVREDEEAATIKANEAQALQNECESELAEAIPALEASASALDTLKVSNPSSVLLLCTMFSSTLHVGKLSKSRFLFHFSPMMSQLSRQ